MEGSIVNTTESVCECDGVEKIRIIESVQIVLFRVDSIPVAKFVPEKPAEVLLAVIWQQILTDQDGTAFFSVDILHDGIIGWNLFIRTGHIGKCLLSDFTEVAAIGDINLRAGYIERGHDVLKDVVFGRFKTAYL